MIDDEQLEPHEVLTSRQHNVSLNSAGDFSGRLSLLSRAGYSHPRSQSQSQNRPTWFDYGLHHDGRRRCIFVLRFICRRRGTDCDK